MYSLDGEPSDVLVRVGVVEQLQGPLGGEHRPTGEEGVQLEDVVLAGVVDAVDDPRQQARQPRQAVLPDLPYQVLLLWRNLKLSVELQHKKDGRTWMVRSWSGSLSAICLSSSVKNLSTFLLAPPMFSARDAMMIF